jgi:phage-related protein
VAERSKDVVFVGNSLDQLRAFPLSARRKAGHQLDRVQSGHEPDDWKPMTSIGIGVREIRLHEATGAYRVIYIAKLADSVFVLHCFKKATQKTSPKDIAVAKSRYETLIRDMAR